MIRHAEAEGQLTRDKIILEPTSGNTGIALAMLAAAAATGFAWSCPNASAWSGAQCWRPTARTGALPAAEGPMVPSALPPDSRRTPAALLHANQYDNPANPAVHFETTGPEIWQQTAGSVDVFVAGMGTSAP